MRGGRPGTVAVAQRDRDLISLRSCRITGSRPSTAERMASKPAAPKGTISLWLQASSGPNGSLADAADVDVESVQ